MNQIYLLSIKKNKVNSIKKWIWSENFLFNHKLALILWFGLPIFDIIHTLSRHSHINNFIIYKNVFYHLIQQKNLYDFYPLEYNDVNLYGPIFSIVIAPFALLTVHAGYVLWSLFNIWVLYFAIMKLPIKKNWQTAILILSCNEMMNNTSWCQVNPFIAALIILGFVYANEGKNIWALFFILLVTFIKLYGIVGFSFYIFNDHKLNFIKWTIIWSIVFFVLPILISNPYYVMHSYIDWYNAIEIKASKNIRMDIHNDFQDISVMGMIKRIFKLPNFKDWWVLSGAVIVYLIQFWHIQNFKDLRFKLYILCSSCIAVVIFSTSSESPTYIIAFPFVCLWYLMQNRSTANNIIFIFALILTCFSYSDIFTPYVRIHLIRPYSLKALPCFLIWIIIIIQIYTRKYLLKNRSEIMVNER